MRNAYLLPNTFVLCTLIITISELHAALLSPHSTLFNRLNKGQYFKSIAKYCIIFLIVWIMLEIVLMDIKMSGNENFVYYGPQNNKKNTLHHYRVYVQLTYSFIDNKVINKYI